MAADLGNIMNEFGIGYDDENEVIIDDVFINPDECDELDDYESRYDIDNSHPSDDEENPDW